MGLGLGLGLGLDMIRLEGRRRRRLVKERDGGMHVPERDGRYSPP